MALVGYTSSSLLKTFYPFIKLSLIHGAMSILNENYRTLSFDGAISQWTVFLPLWLTKGQLLPCVWLNYTTGNVQVCCILLAFLCSSYYVISKLPLLFESHLYL